MSDRQKNLAVFSVVVTLILIFILFSRINFDPEFSDIFLGFLLGIGILILLNRRIDIPIVRATLKPVNILVWSVGGYIVFLLASTLILPLVGIVQKLTFTTLSQLFSENILFFSQARQPALAGNDFLVGLAFGITIPIAETVLFVLLFEKFHDFFNRRPDIRQGITIAAIVVTSTLFALFHLTAKGGAPDPALIMTAIFMAISLTIATIRKQSIEAIFIHIIANSIAISITLQIVPIIVSVIIVFGLFLVLSNPGVQRTLERGF